VKLILGSSSPRRRELLWILFDKIGVIKPNVDETPGLHESAKDFALRIAEDKMKAVLKNADDVDSKLFVTSDTIVVLDNKIYGKPASRAEAFNMLRSLSGRSHSVFTSLSLCYYDAGNRIARTDFEETTVEFFNLSDETVNEYLDLVDYSDKAGSYAVQEHGSMIVKNVNGSASNVVGLPMRLFLKMANNMKILTLL